MALTEIINGTLVSSSSAGEQTLYSSGATSGIYVAKLNLNNYGRINPVVVSIYDLVADGANASKLVYQDTFRKTSDEMAYTPPLPTINGYSLTVSTPTASANIPWSVLSLGTPIRVSHGSTTLTGSGQQIGASVGGGIFMIKLDLTPVANGDEVACYAYDTTFSSSGTGLVFHNHWMNTQRFPIKHSIPMLAQVTSGLSFYVWQPSGTFRTVGYEILQLT